MENEAIARRFFRLAALMEIRGDDPFRLRSYRNAAEAIEVWPTSLKEIAEKEGVTGLQEIPGVGKAIAGKVIELLEKGSFDAWDRLTAETPESVLDLTEIPGIGPKTAALLHQRFKVSSLPELRTFVTSGGLNQVEGIGPKTAEKIKEADGVLIVVDADRKLRYDRIFARKTGKDLVDFDTFVEQEEREWFGAEGEHDMNIKKVMDMADHTIFNNGTLPELHTQIDELLANLFK